MIWRFNNIKKKCSVLIISLFLSSMISRTIFGNDSQLRQDEQQSWQEENIAEKISFPKKISKRKKKVLSVVEETIQRSREITIWENMKPEDSGEETLMIMKGESADSGEETAIIEKPDNYKDPTFYKQVIMIGDSRTVGLSQVCESPQGVTVIWSCKGAMGYVWMRDTGAPQIEPYLSDDTAIVILMGVNDVHFINEYLEYVNQKSLDWALRGADTYFCTVGPLSTESLYVTNPEVIAFNEALHQGLNSNVKIIELYDHMVTHGFATFDGIHYSISTDLDMFQYILSCLVNENGGVPGSIW